jgi:hypothetical protein
MRETPMPLFEKWRVLYDWQPWDEERQEHRHGVLCELVASCHPDRVNPRPPVHYMTCREQLPEEMPQTEDGLKAAAEGINKALTKRKKKKAT